MKEGKIKKGNGTDKNPLPGFQQIDVKGDIYEQIYKYSVFPKIVHDMEMNILDVNLGALNEFGYTREEILEKKVFDLHTPDELSHSEEVLEEMQQKNGLSVETRFKRKDGTSFEAEATPIKYMLGDKPLIHVYIQNISERKAAERKLKELNDALEVEISKVELHAKQLEQKNKELEEFSYVAAHDLKAPITNLNLLASLIDIDAIVGAQNIELYGKLKNNIEQVHKTIFILNDVIKFKTTLKDKKQLLKFDDVFSELKQSITEQLKEDDASIVADFSACPEINYPPLHLKSVIQNLLTNAVKYKHPDRKLNIEVSSSQENGRICLTVKDNGLGFEADKYHEKLFRLFKRLHNHVGGKGVGMYIVKSIIDTHEGEIVVSSQPNEGAVFDIYLNT